MSGSVSRRGLAKAGAAALGAMSMPAATTALANALPAPAAQDAALAALIYRHEVVDAEYRAIAEHWDELYGQWQEEKPARPKALNARHAEGLGAFPITGQRHDGSMGLIYGELEVEQIRTTMPRPVFIGSTEPCLRVGARRAEVLAAYDPWKAECDALFERIGVPAAEAKAGAAGKVTAKIEMDILGYVPRTLAGFAMKAKWIAAQEDVAEDWAVQIMRDLCSLGEAA